MKVSSIVDQNFQEVIIDEVSYMRFDTTSWVKIILDGYKWIDDEKKINKLEAAYQKFKNPPFEIEKVECEDVVKLTINNSTFKVKYECYNTMTLLEQALNGLMEEK
jgi:hypothetical protein